MILLYVFQWIALIMMILLSVAFFTLLERKIMAYSQFRKGPEKVSLVGTLQPVSDAVKLITKIESTPKTSETFLYFFPPGLSFLLSLGVWSLFPSSWGGFLWSYSVIILSIYFSVIVYGLIFTGWFSNSKFAFLGCVRAIVQSISYEVGLTLLLGSLSVILSTLILIKMVDLQQSEWLFVAFPTLSVILFVILLAETSRPPFDLSEGESELVSGYCVEYGGLNYTVLFLTENISMTWAMGLVSSLFFGSSFISWALLMVLAILIRSSYPRFRFDLLMMFFWVSLFPLEICSILLYIESITS